jgi:outer membrane protein assembly factor BamB
MKIQSSQRARGALKAGGALAFVLTSGCTDTIGGLLSDGRNGDRVVWKAADIRSPVSASALAADSTFVFAYTSSQSIAAARLTDGRTAWSATADETTNVAAVPKGLSYCAGTVVFGSYLALYGVEPATGARRWRWRPSIGGGFDTGYPVCAEGTVYVGTSVRMRLYAVDARTGRERWSIDVGSQPNANGFVATPAVTADVVIGCTREFTLPKTGMAIGVDAATGRERWRYRWDAAPSSNGDASCALFVAAADGIAVVAADDGRLFGLDATSGALRWTAPATGEAAVRQRDERPITISNGVVVAGSATGIVVGVDLATGGELWRTPPDDLTSMIDGLASDAGQVVGVTQSGWALAFDSRTGARQWTVKSSNVQNVRLLFDTGVLTKDLFIAVSPDALYALRR